MPVGFRVYLEINRHNRDTVSAVSSFSTASLTDAMNGFNLIESSIRPLHNQWSPWAGTAITVDVTPGDGLMIRKAIDTAKPGDVLVVNAHGCRERAVLGGSVAIDMLKRGVLALVVDGAVRDVEEMKALEFPVFARNAVARSGTTESGWGEVNLPIACGGVVVFPGDVVVADSGGLLVVPAPDVTEVSNRAAEIEKKKGRPEDIQQRLQDRKWPNPGSLRADRAISERGGSVVSGCYRRG